MMKRAREEEYVYDQDRDSETANFLMLLSKVGDTKEIIINRADFVTSKKESSSGRVFTCKTCNREFPSFQALGGHRASHKKLPKLSPFSDDGGAQNPTSPPKPKTHECSICGLEFAIGQALGGHMRRHRQQVAAAAADDHHDDRVDRTAQAVVVPVLRKSSSSKRVCADLDLDLHLGPPGDHYDLKLRLMASTVGC